MPVASFGRNLGLFSFGCLVLGIFDSCVCWSLGFKPGVDCFR